MTKFCAIAMFFVTSPIVINVPTRGLLAVKTMHAIVQWLANLNIKRCDVNVCKQETSLFGKPEPQRLVFLSFYLKFIAVFHI